MEPQDYSDLSTPAEAQKQDYSDLSQPAESPVSAPKEDTHTSYLPDRDVTVEHPASMSHDQVNDAVQTGIYERPRNFSFNPTPPELLKGAANIINLNIADFSAQFGEQAGINEPKMPSEAAKSAVRMAESVPRGVAGLLDMMGQNLSDQAKIVDPGYQKNLAYQVGKGMAEIGKTAFDFYKDRGENGPEAPDPEVFRGSFMSNPSVTRLVSGIIENVPLVAATAAASATTGGVAPLMLFGGMAGGESFEAAKANGEDTQKASLVGVASGIGNVVLMSLPIGEGIQAITKGALPETIAHGASFAALGAVMTPFNNITARLGGEKSRKLFDGMAESLITMAVSGFILGGMTPGRGLEIDGLIQEAHKEGVSPHDIDAAREAIAKQIQDNPKEVTKAMLEHRDKTAAPAAEDALTSDQIESKRGEIVKTIAESLKKGEGVPEQFSDHHDLIDQALAENKRTDKNAKRSETIIESMSEQYLAGEKPKTDSVSPDIVNEAKQRTIDKINDLEESDGKIRNRYQDLRFRLTKELSDYSDNVKNSTEATNQAIQERAQKEQELKNEYETKAKQYKALYGEPSAQEIASVDRAAKSQAQSEFVREVSQGRERKASDSAAALEKSGGARTVNLKTGEPKSGVAPGPIEGGEREGKSKGFEKFKSSLEKSVRERIEKNADLSGSFGRMDAAEDAAKGIKFVEEQPERARRVALGLEAPPAGVSDVAVSAAYSEKMKREGNSLEQARAELSLSLRGTRQAQELAARAYRVGDNSPEQFIQKVIQARKDMAGKKFFDFANKEKRSERVTKKISDESRNLSDRLKSKQLDIEAAQKILEDNKC